MRIVIARKTHDARESGRAVYVGQSGDEALAAALAARRDEPDLRFFQTVNPPLYPLTLPVEANVLAGTAGSGSADLSPPEEPKPKSKSKSKSK